MEPLKNLYYPESSFLNLAEELYKIYPKFSVQEFYQEGVSGLDELELKERIARTVEVCHRFLSKDYCQNLEIFREYLQGRENSFYYLFTSQYVAIYGLEFWDESMEALKNFTKYSSSEEGIRYFLLKDFSKAMKEIMKWCEDGDEHVRRLCSEGTRSRLPWAVQLKDVVNNPSLTFPILERLKSDQSRYVQKSVANHINDISKDHPDWLVKKVKMWDVDTYDSQKWVLKHGMRSLIKEGNRGALRLFGYDSEIELEVLDFQFVSKVVGEGEKLEFSFFVKSNSVREQNLVIDYKIFFVRKNGKKIAKVFKLSNKKLRSYQKIKLHAAYSFVKKSTRKHYAGKHRIEILINGNIVKGEDFSYDD